LYFLEHFKLNKKHKYKIKFFRPTDAPLKPLFIVALLKLYPYTCFDIRIIVRVLFESYCRFSHIIFEKKKTPDDDPRIETRVGV
jgi:hypothetical protein